MSSVPLFVTTNISLVTVKIFLSAVYPYTVPGVLAEKRVRIAYLFSLYLNSQWTLNIL